MSPPYARAVRRNRIALLVMTRLPRRITTFARPAAPPVAAANRVPAAAAALADAHAQRDDDAAEEAARELRDARSRLDRACAAARASFFERRLTDARDDPRALRRASAASSSPRSARSDVTGSRT